MAVTSYGILNAAILVKYLKQQGYLTHQKKVVPSHGKAQSIIHPEP